MVAIVEAELQEGEHCNIHSDREATKSAERVHVETGNGVKVVN